MRLLIQRVKEASVTVANEMTGQIDRGIMVFVAFSNDYTLEKGDQGIRKLLNMRIFPDSQQKMNYSLKDTTQANGPHEILVVSQFTLFGDLSRGNRPSFTTSARPDGALKHYNQFVARLKEEADQYGIGIATGRFGAEMEVRMVGDGPVTLLVEL
ncbi:MAG: D-aminoacyl-tRNA deacylase [Chlamydiia bacterium]|nr:D-aminoacyl-tRNA deacylase [Chlamydiia bacterium]